MATGEEAAETAEWGFPGVTGVGDSVQHTPRPCTLLEALSQAVSPEFSP